jgi:hypothetical protein
MRLMLASLVLLAACTVETWPEGSPSAPPLGTSGVTAPSVGVTETGLEVGRIDFGLIAVGGQAAGTATITNASASAVETGAVMIHGAGFEVQATTCAGSIAAGASCEVTVTFTPDALGRFDGAIAIAPDGRVVSGALSGTGGGVVQLSVIGGGRVDGGEGVACVDSCATVIARSMALHATPDAGHQFVMWQGACAGRDACAVTPEPGAQEQVRAVFATN